MGNYLGGGAPSNGPIYFFILPDRTDENKLAEFLGTIGLLKLGSLTRKRKEQVDPRYGHTETERHMRQREALELHKRTLMNMKNGGGKARGQSDSAGKTWEQDGDWLCPNTSCSNVNFAFREACNCCGTARPKGASSTGGVVDSGRRSGADDSE